MIDVIGMVYSDGWQCGYILSPWTLVALQCSTVQFCVKCMLSSPLRMVVVRVVRLLVSRSTAPLLAARTAERLSLARLAVSEMAFFSSKGACADLFCEMTLFSSAVTDSITVIACSAQRITTLTQDHRYNVSNA